MENSTTNQNYDPFCQSKKNGFAPFSLLRSMPWYLYRKMEIKTNHFDFDYIHFTFPCMVHPKCSEIFENSPKQLQQNIVYSLVLACIKVIRSTWALFCRISSFLLKFSTLDCVVCALLSKRQYLFLFPVIYV